MSLCCAVQFGVQQRRPQSQPPQFGHPSHLTPAKLCEKTSHYHHCHHCHHCNRCTNTHARAHTAHTIAHTNTHTMTSPQHQIFWPPNQSLTWRNAARRRVDPAMGSIEREKLLNLESHVEDSRCTCIGHGQPHTLHVILCVYVFHAAPNAGNALHHDPYSCWKRTKHARARDYCECQLVLQSRLSPS